MSGILRGNAVAALFATTAIFAGMQALAPSVASAERADCTFDADQVSCIDGDSSDGGSGATAPGGASTGTSGQQPSANYSWGWDPSPAPEPEGFDNPFKPDPAIERALNGTQPILRSMDPDYIAQLTNEHRLDRKIVWSTDFRGYIFVLSEDCYRLSSMIGTLDNRERSLSHMVKGEVAAGPGAVPFRRSLRSVKTQKHERSVEYGLLECATVLSLDGRD